MLVWIGAHAGDLAVIALIVLACVFILRGLIRDRRAGKRGCDGNCAACSGGENCRPRGKPPRR